MRYSHFIYKVEIFDEIMWSLLMKPGRLAGMTIPASEPVATQSRAGMCQFPGVLCENPVAGQADAKGRPPIYCGRVAPNADGRPVRHNAGNAWAVNNAAKKARGDRSVGAEQGLTPGAVTMARATFEVQLEDLRKKLYEFESFRTALTGTLDALGDAEAAAEEVEQVRTEARAQLAEAEARTGDESRRRRDADKRAADAENARDEAEDAAQVAYEELAQVRAETEELLSAAQQARQEAENARDAALAEVEQVRAETGERIREIQQTANREIAQARQEAENARDAALAEVEQVRAETGERIREIQQTANREIAQARQEAENATVAQVAAEADQHSAEQQAATRRELLERARTELQEARQQHRVDLDDLRREARNDLQQARNDHLAQVEDLKQAAVERVDVLKTALSSAERANEALRRQLADDRGDGPPNSLGGKQRLGGRSAGGDPE
jgi:hypothetical protein